jgi:hypothetical protein
MRRFLKLGFAALALVVFTRATCGKPKEPQVTPVEQLSFDDHVYYHNMGITWDGNHYFTVNGGNTGYSNLNEYDDEGGEVETYDLGIDGRAILYDPDDEQLYVKTFSTDLTTVDLILEETDTEHEGMFQGDQTSVAMSPDGEKLYELFEGEVFVYDAETGEEESSFKLSSVSEEEAYGYKYAIAASDRFLFVWAPKSETEILVYGLDGKYVTRFALPRSGFGFSLSWANDMLWIAKDADGSSDGEDGTWYGYALKGLE